MVRRVGRWGVVVHGEDIRGEIFVGEDKGGGVVMSR